MRVTTSGVTRRTHAGPPAARRWARRQHRARLARHGLDGRRPPRLEALENAAVLPGAISAIVETLGRPALVEAVTAVDDTARAEPGLRAARLRDELARVEAELDTRRSS